MSENVPFKQGDELILSEKTLAEAVQYWLNAYLRNTFSNSQKVSYVSKHGADGKFISGIRVVVK